MSSPALTTASNVNPSPTITPPGGFSSIAGVSGYISSLFISLTNIFREHANSINGLTNGFSNLTVFTVATLPTVGVKGRRAFVSDANATTFASIVAGSGSNTIPVYDDGTHWRIG